MTEATPIYLQPLSIHLDCFAKIFLSVFLVGAYQAFVLKNSSMGRHLQISHGLILARISP